MRNSKLPNKRKKELAILRETALRMVDAGQRTVRAIERMTAPQVPTKVYSFQYAFDTYDGGFGVVSLHLSKRSAWKAMHAHKYASEVRRREAYLSPRYNLSPTFDGSRLGRRRYQYHPSISEGWRVMTHEVLP